MTASPAAIRALADRIEALTEPSREVDAEVLCALWVPEKFFPQRLTASLDAAMALKDELLPGWECLLDIWLASASAELRESGEMGYAEARVIAPPKYAAPCALVAAVLRAVAGKEAGGG